jgi:SAM-dependent methyltransferase
MREVFSILSGRLRCPDDQGVLLLEPSAFHCPLCARRFPIVGENFIELLPKSPRTPPAEFKQTYVEGYFREFHRPLTFVENHKVSEARQAEKRTRPRYDVLSLAQESASSWIQKRNREVKRVSSLLVQKSSFDSILCDFSAGPGHYTLSYAPQFSVVLHCDLSVDSLLYAMRKAAHLKLENVIFLRMDYFSPPFQNSLDQIICLDTLIRGKPHEAALLRAIHQSLTPEGFAIVDFHNWWHNPLRRLGLLRQNFGENESYDRQAAENLLHEARIANFEYFSFFQEFDQDKRASGFLSRIIPPTRLIYRFSGLASRHALATDLDSAPRQIASA